MKKVFLSVLLVCVATVSFAQSSYQDVIYLKNGSRIKGVIIEQVPNQSLKLETKDGNIFVYQMVEVEKMAKEVLSEKTKNHSDSDFESLSGYRGSVDLGYALGVGDYGMDRIKLQFTNDWYLNPYFGLGFGTGVHYYLDADAAVVPLFADLRANFLDGKTSPYLSVGVGYSFDATNGFEGVGLYLNPTIGVNFKMSNTSSISVGFGYEMQQMPFYSYYYSYEEFSENSGAISIKLGVSF